MTKGEKQRRVEQSQQSQAYKRLLDDYLSKSQLAAELGITERSLDRYAWLRTGPPRIKVGGRVYYHRARARAWLESQVGESA